MSPPPTTPVLTGQPGEGYTTVVDGVTISGGQDDPTRARSADGKLMWDQPGHWSYDGVAAIDDGAVFAVEYLDNGSRLVGYEIDNGEIRWEANGEPHLEGLWPWLADDQQLFTGWGEPAGPLHPRREHQLDDALVGRGPRPVSARVRARRRSCHGRRHRRYRARLRLRPRRLIRSCHGALCHGHSSVADQMPILNPNRVTNPAARIEELVDRAVMLGQRVGGCPAGSDSNLSG